MTNISIRDPLGSDDIFIRSTWQKGLYFGNKALKQFDKADIDAYLEDVISEVLVRPLVEIKVASLTEDEEVALGYCVYEATILHWVYVKPAWHKLGIARRLVPTTIDKYTYSTDVGRIIIHKKALAIMPVAYYDKEKFK